MKGMSLRLGDQPMDVVVNTLVIAGWAGRDAEKVQHHISELAAIGVPPPTSTPVFYRVASSLLSTDDVIECIGSGASGEVECVLLNVNDELWIGIGSDHTDREAETVGITLSKQLCGKPVAPTFWRFGDVEGHWDSLMIRSYKIDQDVRTLYQEGPVTDLLEPRTLLTRYGQPFVAGSAMFCGTVPVIGAIVGAEEFEIELVDPVLNRTLSHRYRCRSLPVAG